MGLFRKSLFGVVFLGIVVWFFLDDEKKQSYSDNNIAQKENLNIEANNQSSTKKHSLTNKKIEILNEQDEMVETKIVSNNEVSITAGMSTEEKFQRSEQQLAYDEKVKQNKDLDMAFELDEFDSEWSAKITETIYNQVLFPDGSPKYESLSVDQLECKGHLCLMEFRPTTDDEALWDQERAQLLYELINLGVTSERVNGRSLRTKFLDDGGIRYYFGRMVGD